MTITELFSWIENKHNPDRYECNEKTMVFSNGKSAIYIDYLKHGNNEVDDEQLTVTYFENIERVFSIDIIGVTDNVLVMIDDLISNHRGV